MTTRDFPNPYVDRIPGAQRFTPPVGTESWWPVSVDPNSPDLMREEWHQTGIDPETYQPTYGMVKRRMTAQELLNFAQDGGFGPEVAKAAQAAPGKKPRKEPADKPEIIEIGGESYLFNPNNGSFEPLHKAAENFDQLIVGAIADGDWEKADKLQQFRDRPSDLDVFKAAMDYAKSPADAYTISALARGEQPAPSAGPGDLRRLGPPSGAVTDAYNRLFGKREAPSKRVSATAMPVSEHLGDTDLSNNVPPQIASEAVQSGVMPPETTEQAKAFIGTSMPPDYTAGGPAFTSNAQWAGLAALGPEVQFKPAPGSNQLPGFPWPPPGTISGLDQRAPILVGERGPEVMQAPVGAQITPLPGNVAATGQATGGTYVPEVDPDTREFLRSMGVQGYADGGVVGRPPAPANPYPTPMVLFWDHDNNKWSWMPPYQAEFLRRNGSPYEMHGLQTAVGTSRTRAVDSPTATPTPVPTPTPAQRALSDADRIARIIAKYPGIQQLIGGGPIEAPKLGLQSSGLRTPSPQGWSNLLPSEQAGFRELGALQGWNPADFERQLRAGTPGPGNQTVRTASARRSRYV